MSRTKFERTAEMLGLGFIADRAILGEDDALEKLQNLFEELAATTAAIRRGGLMARIDERWRDVTAAIAKYTLVELQRNRDGCF